MKKGFVLIHLILLTLVSFLGARMLYSQVDDRPKMLTNFVPLEKNSRGLERKMQIKPPSRQHYTAIEQRNLFKTALEENLLTPATASEPLPVESLEKTSLDLTLLGTIILEPQGAFAIIREGRKKEQKRYQKGDVVQHAQIKEVFREKVVLHYKGRDEVLMMGAAKGSDIPTSQTFPPPSQAMAGEPGEKTSLSRSLVDEALANINKLMGDVRVRPHFSRGKPDGLLLYGIKKDSLFQTMGLKNGDIIMGVDGREIESVDDALTFYEQLKESSDVNVQIKRRGRTKEIQYHVE